MYGRQKENIYMEGWVEGEEDELQVFDDIVNGIAS